MSNNLIHTAHNETEVSLNERENACLDYDKEGASIAHIVERLAHVKTGYF